MTEISEEVWDESLDSIREDSNDEDYDHNLDAGGLGNNQAEIVNPELNMAQDLNHLSDSLELKLIAEAGATLISLKKLLTLSVGDIFDIADLPPKVNLVINNVVIGYGTLVEFNGRIGVKITSLVKNTLNINMTN